MAPRIDEARADGREPTAFVRAGIATRRLVRAAEVKRLLGIRADSTLWRMIRDGRIPGAHYIGTRRVWWSDEIEAAISALVSGQGMQS
jgi:predicted DNA-binding transcriptional regulator AlpA